MQPKIKFERPEKILVIRRDNIGDLVCTTPVFAALRQHYPNSKIGALVNSYNSEALCGNPDVDQVFVYKKLKHVGGFVNRLKALAQRIKLIIQLRRWQPDITILAKSSYDRHGLNFARQIGAKNVIGFVPDDFNQHKWLPDIQLKTPKFAVLHEVEAVNRLLVPLGINDAPGPLRVFPDASLVAKIKHQLPEAKRRIALHISAREAERRWGIDNFIAFAEYILQTRSNTQILLLWSPGKADDLQHPGDDDAAARLLQSVQVGRLVPVPTQSLTELIAALSLCDLFVGTDGGAMHLAAGLNKPCVALFENLTGKLNHWYPWKVAHQVVHSEQPGMPNIAKIPLSEVVRALGCLGY